MCGIAGFSGQFSPELPQKMVNAIAHRGPDDHGIWLSDDGQIGLGHARLSIIDLSPDGHQPMASSDGQLQLVFNGEIYNFKDLRKQLEECGHIFKSSSDSEVLLYMYREHGCEMLPRLNGIFAFAIYDKAAQTIFLARDHLGIKPLYYSETETGTIFCSELKGLLQFTGLAKEIDLQAVNYHLAYIWNPAPHTMFKSVSKMLPGNACIIKDGKIEQLWQWYQPPFNDQRLEMNDRDIPQALALQLEKAVERQLVADVPVGAFLSGGLDSSAVVAMMRKLMPDRPIKCYCIGFDTDDEVEGCPADLPYAKKVAKHLKVDLEEIRIKPQQLIERLAELIWFLDEPQADPAPVNAMFIAEKARADGIKVLLSGAGGDDIFTGYRRHHALKTEFFWSWLPENARKKLRKLVLKYTDVRSAWGRRLVKVFANAHLPEQKRLLNYYQWSPDQVRKAIFAPEYRKEIDFDKTSCILENALNAMCHDSDPINHMLFLDTRFFLPDHNLNYTDKTCMRYGVEARVPLLDPELIDFACKIPPRLKQTFTNGKAVFKKAMEPFLPHDVIYRKKTAFGAPLRQWVRNDLRQIISTMLSREKVDQRGIFDGQAVEKLILDDQQGKLDGSYTVFSILCIEIWCQLFIDGTSYRDIKI